MHHYKKEQPVEPRWNKTVRTVTMVDCGDSPILFSVENGLGRITLNRPARLNAFNTTMAEEWSRVAQEATARSDVTAVLIQATGNAFCAGGDVLAMAETMRSGAELRNLAKTINVGILALINAPIPVIAAAQGTTAGGGLGILLATDYAVVATNSKLGALYGKIGLTPDLSISAHLARAVGERRALQLVLQDRLLSAQEALDWGLVAEVVAPEDVNDRASSIASAWIAGATGAYGQAKRLVRQSAGSSIFDQLDEEARTIGAAFDTREAAALIGAFAARSLRAR